MTCPVKMMDFQKEIHWIKLEQKNREKVIAVSMTSGYGLKIRSVHSAMVRG